MRRSSLSAAATLLVVLALAGAGCRRDQIRTYVVDKEAAPPKPAPAAAPAMSGTLPPAAPRATMSNTAVDTASGPGLAWETPSGWSAGPERPMRKATLLVPGEGGGPGAEVSVTAFPGDVGGNLANVNRWRQQLSLPAIGQADLGSAVQHFDVGDLHIDFVELAGTATPAQRVLGAIVPYAGATWFFKLSGPDAVVTREKETFLAFLRSLHPQG